MAIKMKPVQTLSQLIMEELLPIILTQLGIFPSLSQMQLSSIWVLTISQQNLLHLNTSLRLVILHATIIIIHSLGYNKFISFIQSKYLPVNPNLQMFVVCGPMISTPCCTYVQNVVNRQSSNVHYIDMQNILKFPDDIGT